MIKKNPTVTVATRTCNRPLYLQRALGGLLSQSRRDFEWIIVNEGGDREVLETCAKTARDSGLDVTILHNEEAVGRGPAANQAVRAGSAPFVLLHDDDDRLAPTFLERTVSFLDSHPEFAGVAVQIQRVIEDEDRHETDRKILNPYTRAFRLVDIAERNQFSPIGFLYRRKAYDTAGGYAEDVPVLEDWIFNLKIMEEGDIGVIAEPLAEYFWRNSTSVSDPGSNTVVAGRDEHLDYEVIIRNRLLREDLQAGKLGLGWLLNPAHQLAADRINEAVNRANWLRKPGQVLSNWWRTLARSGR